MNFLAVFVLSFGICTLSKLGLLVYKMHCIKQLGYKLKLKNIKSLLLTLDLNSWLDGVIFFTPMVNMLKELQNYFLYEANHGFFFDKVKANGIIEPKNCCFNVKHKHDYSKKDDNQTFESQSSLETFNLNDDRQELVNDSLNDLKPKVYTKVKKR